MTRLRRTRNGVAIVLSMAMFAGGCAFNAPEDSLIGVRKVSLLLLFKDDALAAPVPDSVIVTLVPATPDAIQRVVPDDEPPDALPQPVPEPCPKAPPGSTPEEPAAVAITRPPQEGTYLKQNQGSIRVTGGAIPLTFPYPPYTTVVISNVKRTQRSDIYAGNVTTTTFESEEILTPALRVKSYYSYEQTQLVLVREEVVSEGQVTTFAPSPALVVLPFTGPGATWNSAGIDGVSSAAGTIQGAIAAKREVRDVCGTMVDTLRVSTSENRVSLSDGTQSGTDPNRPTVQNYAPQHGGLVLFREEHSTRIVNVNGAKLTLNVDVVSTLQSIEPDRTLSR